MVNHKLIMNGWYMHNINKFPSDKITPLFISVHINNENLIKNNISYFKNMNRPVVAMKQQLNCLKNMMVNAYFTGCLTLLFDDVKEKIGGKYLVDVNTKCNYIPDVSFDTSKYKDFEIIEHDINPNITLDIRLTAEDLQTSIEMLNCVTRLVTVYCLVGHSLPLPLFIKTKNDPIQGLKNINGDNKLNDKNIQGNREEIEIIRTNFLLQQIYLMIILINIYVWKLRLGTTSFT